MEIADKIKQAEYEGNIYFCPNCKKKQPIELAHYDPDEDVEPDLEAIDFIVCLICHIDNMHLK